MAGNDHDHEERRTMMVVRDKPLQLTAMLIWFFQVASIGVIGWAALELRDIKEYAREGAENIAEIKTIAVVNAVQIENVGRALDHHIANKGAHE